MGEVVMSACERGPHAGGPTAGRVLRVGPASPDSDSDPCTAGPNIRTGPGAAGPGAHVTQGPGRRLPGPAGRLGGPCGLRVSDEPVLQAPNSDSDSDSGARPRRESDPAAAGRPGAPQPPGRAACYLSSFPT
jgi:hypothetical protein